jgi:tetratricopeptide (TPR) repeat protein
MTKRPKGYQAFFAELKRRHVFKVAAVYGVVSFGVLQAADLLIEGLQLSPDVLTTITVVVVLGFPIAIVMAWAYEMSPEGVKRTDPAAFGELEAIVAQPRSRRWPAGVLALIGIVLLSGGGWWVMNRGRTIQRVELAPSLSAVAVLPFRATGSDLVVWREGLMDVVSANLDGVGNLRSVDTRTIMSHWRGRFGEDDPPTEAAVGLAGDLGARWAVHGQAVELGGQIRIDTRIYDAETGEQEASTSVSGPPDSMLALSEGMTLALLRELGEHQDVGDQGRAYTTTSLEAVRAYLEGVQAMRRSDWDPAIESLERALQIDSTFAIAAFRLSESYGWKYFAGHPNSVEANDRALRFADRLPPRDRDMLTLRSLADRGRAPESLDLAQRLTSRYPTDPEAWYELGEVYFHLGDIMGIPMSEWGQPFERALALDSSYLSPMMHLMDLTQRLGDWDGFERYVGLYSAYDSTSEEAVSRQRVLAIVRGSPADSLEALESLASADSEELRQTALAALVDASVAPFLVRVVYEMTDARHPVRQRENAWRFWVNLVEIWLGRPSAAHAALDSAEALGINLRGVALHRLYQLARGMGDTAKAASVLEAGRETGLFQSPSGRWALGTYHLYLDELDRADADADTLDLIADSLNAVGDSTNAYVASGYAQGLRGMLAGRRGEFDEAVTTLRESILQSGNLSGFVAVNHQRLALAIALIEAGRDEEALQVLEAGFEGNVYIDVPGALLRGQLYERRGEREQAIRAYSRVVELWRDCDPELIPQREVAERALQRLLAEG